MQDFRNTTLGIIILNHPSILKKFGLSYTSPISNDTYSIRTFQVEMVWFQKVKSIFGIPLPPTHTPQERKNLCLLSLHVPQAPSVFLEGNSLQKEKQNPYSVHQN